MKGFPADSTFSFPQPSFLSPRSLIMSFPSCCRLFIHVNSYVSGHISHPASFINMSRAFRDVVGPTEQYWNTNFKYLPNSTPSCTLTQRDMDWNFPLEWTRCYNLLGSQHTGQSAYCSLRWKPSGESSCPVQIPWNASPRVESLFTDRTSVMELLHSAAHLDWH